ncbi:hypothetical protein O6H91_07G003200 [Diphasiastrum complanatum]|uniref:Uncharacterized protein n=1 Tax=Diphasiastrum complanatum TaxID=34168 RepID=A0ACC2D1Y8_DIPCM|nr:hypothetical protein O6H91_07G003200 [Diphasiastrum complanatum]
MGLQDEARSSAVSHNLDGNAMEATLKKKEIKVPNHEAGVRKSNEASLWVSFGSEKEIEGERIHASQELVVVRASRKRKEFGLQHSFADRDAMETFSSGQMECRPFNDPSYDKVIAEQDVGIQSIPSMKDMASQTMQEVPRNNCVQYQPRKFDAVEQKHIMASEPMSSYLKSIKMIYTDALQQNEVMDLFEDDFSSFGEEDDHFGRKSVNVITEYMSFSDLSFSKGKMISAIDWMPGKQGILAAACCESKPFDERLQSAGKPSNSYVLVWSFVDPIHPQIMLESYSDIFSLRFNPSSPQFIAGGCHSGQVILWDISLAQEQMERKSKVREDYEQGKEKDKSHKAPVVLCSLLSLSEKSHNSIVSDLHWLPDGLQLDASGKITKGHAGKAHILLSVAADGKVIFWDISCKRHEYIDPDNEKEAAEVASEKYKWCPVIKIDLAYGYPQRLVGPLKMTFSIDSHFFCSTEFGEVCSGDFCTARASIIKHISESHFGQVRALQRSPFFEDILLSIDIWTFALWKEDYMKPIFVSRSAEGYLTTGGWSPSRPAVLYIGHIDGSIEVWDLLDHSHQPTTTVSIGSCQVTSMEFWKQTCEALNFVVHRKICIDISFVYLSLFSSSPKSCHKIKLVEYKMFCFVWKRCTNPLIPA